MIRRISVVAAAAVAGALVLGGGAWLATRGGSRAQAPRADERAAARTLDLAPDAHMPAPADAESPELARHRNALAFQSAVRDFFDSSARLGEAERRARADALLAQIEARESSGALRAPEALMLRLGVARALEDDPAVLESEMRRISEEYREAQERAAASHVPDPRDARYQRAQADIAREVMAIQDIPGGLTREEYLRERLRDARTEIYGDPN
jgi:hypothetical protein